MQLRIFGAHIGLAFVSLSVLIGCRQNLPPKDRPKAVHGVLDLSNWDLARDGLINLSGQYEFYWQQHVRPESFEGPNPPGPSGFINVPGSWNGYELVGKKLGGEGY